MSALRVHNLMRSASWQQWIWDFEGYDNCVGKKHGRLLV